MNYATNACTYATIFRILNIFRRVNLQTDLNYYITWRVTEFFLKAAREILRT